LAATDCILTVALPVTDCILTVALSVTLPVACSPAGGGAEGARKEVHGGCGANPHSESVGERREAAQEWSRAI
jgi:hypothetical protein